MSIRVDVNQNFGVQLIKLNDKLSTMCKLQDYMGCLGDLGLGRSLVGFVLGTG